MNLHSTPDVVASFDPVDLALPDRTVRVQVLSTPNLRTIDLDDLDSDDLLEVSQALEDRRDAWFKAPYLCLVHVRGFYLYPCEVAGEEWVRWASLKRKADPESGVPDVGGLAWGSLADAVVYYTEVVPFIDEVVDAIEGA
jgi:hypothetical protein